ncbi:MAG: hypothetical protein COC23_08470, partial [Hyphomicrobiales bacterium]
TAFQQDCAKKKQDVLATIHSSEEAIIAQKAKLFDEIVSNQTTPRAIGQRARLLRELIASQGGPEIVK